MKLLFLKLILLLSIYRVYSNRRIRTNSRPYEQCGFNEEFDECGTSCGESCNEAGICRYRTTCEIGCFCKTRFGYFRNRRGLCVPLEQCGRRRKVWQYSGLDKNEQEMMHYKESSPFEEIRFNSLEESRHSPGDMVIKTQSQCSADEIYSDCGNYCAESCDNIHNPSACTPNWCDTGCFCRIGLHRSREGNCVPEEECRKRIRITINQPLQPVQPPVDECPQNEKFKKCGCHCLEMCENRYNPGACPIFKKEVGCFCIKGFYRNNEGRCVSPESCDLISGPTPPPPARCPAGEEFEECGSRCSESCENIDNPNVCESAPHRCDIGCFCKRGSYRDQEGTCVPIEQCERPEEGLLSPVRIRISTTPEPIPTCPEHEAYTDCGNRCLESLDNIDNPSACPPNRCDIGCFCIHGFYRDHIGFCISPPPPTALPPPTIPSCPEHQAFTECGNRCLESLDNIENPSACPPNRCDIGCFCIHGFYRDDIGYCISPPPPISTTPPTLSSCPEHEAYTECGNRCLESLDNIDYPSVCLLNRCDIGCFCIRGFYRDDIGFCVLPPPPTTTTTPPPPILPPIQCPRGEEFHECGSRCLENCDNYDNPTVCPPNRCDIGCFCMEGLFRDETGICVPVEHCEEETPPPTTTTQRTTPMCPYFEVFMECGNRCLESIHNFYYPGECQHRECDTGCFCIHGFYRDRDETCTVPIQTTTTPPPPPSCPEHEAFTECGNRCLESLDNIDNPSSCPPNRCDIGCFCIHGFYRDHIGFCVEPPPPPTTTPCTLPSCPEHEAYSECGNRCLESIDNIDNPSVCPLDRCDIGCFCIHGLHRDEMGNCIKPESNILAPIKIRTHPTLPPPLRCPASEEFYDCGNRCLESCEHVDDPLVCPTDRCDMGCFCEMGTFRDKEGICVPIELCHPTPRCPASEEYEECGSRCLESCDNVDNPSVCPPDRCDIGCFCKKGLFRDKGEICVPIELCELPEPITAVRTTTEEECPTTPPPQCRSDEVYSECRSRCLELCANKDDPSVCPPNRCDVGCFCQKGLYRDDEGYCVPDTACVEITNTPCTLPPPSKCPIGEVFRQCASRCAEYCINSEDPSFCPPDTCEVGCFCEKGLFRDDLGVCVPKSECDLKAPTFTPKPPPQECPENEQYDNCGTRCGESCDEVYESNSACETKCETGCFCKEGFLRNCFGTCVQKKDCDFDLPESNRVSSVSTNRVCGHNEKYTVCGNECGRTCADRDKNPICNKKCRVGCFCISGYLRDEDGECVLPKDCTANLNP